jgi:iron(III) transport system permease protein
MRTSLRTKILFGFLMAFLAATLLYPIWQVVKGGLIVDGRLDFYFLGYVLKNPDYRAGLVNSLAIACVSTTLVVAISIPLAVIANRYEFRGKTLLSGLLLVPMILPPFVGAVGLRQILGNYGGSLNLFLQSIGLLNSDQFIDWMGEGRFWGIVLLEALHLYPIMYLNVTAALANVDPSMEEASANLGCVGWRRFRRITLPLIMPGLFAGGTIVFIWSFTELGAPLMFDYRRVTAVQIFEGVKEIAGGQNPMPYALVIAMLLASIVLYAIGKLLLGRSGHGMMARATVGRQAVQLRGPAGLLAALPFLVVIAAAGLPHVGVILTSISGQWIGSILPQEFSLVHVHGALGHSLTVPSISNSLIYSVGAVAIDLVIGLAIAWIVVRTRIWGRSLLDALAMLPLAVPGLVMAFGYLAVVTELVPAESPLADWLRPDRNPTLILVIAYGVRRLPYVVRAAAAGLQQTSITLEEAARNLGATPIRTLRRVTAPLIAANLIAGGILAFSFAMLEVSDSLILAQTEQFYPITKAIFVLYQRLGDGPYIASALGVWAMAMLATAIMAASSMLGRRMGALFRV